MTFARGFSVMSWAMVSALLVAACGSADTGLFSETTAGSSKGGAHSSNAGASDASSGGPGSTSGAGGDLLGLAGMAEDVAGTGGGGTAGSEVMGVGGAGGPAHAGTAGSSGAAAGSAGALAGTGGSSGAAAGSGGAPSSAGTAGMSSGGMSAGGTGPGMGCPAAPPAPNNGCQVNTPDSCVYSGLACSCLPVGKASFPRRWACYGTPERCPAAAPTALACKANSRAECPYPGLNFCACLGFGNEAKWSCQPPVPVCPANKPNDGADCNTVRACNYPFDACFCNGSNWGCEGG